MDSPLKVLHLVEKILVLVDGGGGEGVSKFSGCGVDPLLPPGKTDVMLRNCPTCLKSPGEN